MPSRIKVDRAPIVAMLDETKGDAVEAARRLGLHYNTVRTIQKLHNGLCASCGQRPHRKGFTKCAKCAEHERARTAGKRANARRRGQCSMCPQPLRKNSTLYCEEHYQQTFERQRTFRILDRHGPRALEFLKTFHGSCEIWCEICGTTRSEKRIDLHHIDGNHGNDDPANFAVICADCHWITHRLILSRDRKSLIAWFEKTYPQHPLR